MSAQEIDLKPVDFITVDAIGKPGNRVFYLQGKNDDRIITLVIEKVQLQSLAIGIEQFIEDIHSRKSDLSPASEEYDPAEMSLSAPLDPLFRVGELGMSYEDEDDIVVLIAREIAVAEEAVDVQAVVRFWCSRSQLKVLSLWGLEVVQRGRPICPYCGEPEEPEGHICPKKNGRNH